MHLNPKGVTGSSLEVKSLVRDPIYCSMSIKQLQTLTGLNESFMASVQLEMSSLMETQLLSFNTRQRRFDACKTQLY